MSIKFGFSWLAVVVFLLPMIINIIYVLIPPMNADAIQKDVNRIVEFIEQVTRILYLAALVCIVSNKKVDYTNPWMIAALVFLILYYIVWLRYFAGGRDVALLGKVFIFVPMPLAVFPVLYFMCAAIWLNNSIAFGIMVVFGIAHNIISYQSFH